MEIIESAATHQVDQRCGLAPSGLVVGLDDFMLARQPFQRTAASAIALTAETSADSQAIVMTRNAT